MDLNDNQEDPAGTAEQPRILLILLVVVVVLGIAVVVVLPNLLAANLCGAYETAAIATLRNLAAVEEQFRNAGDVDTDGDGAGEFGTLRELTGAVALRAAPGAAGRILNPPRLSPALAGVTTEGWVEKSHYAYAVFLPRAGGGWIRESGTAAAGPPETRRGCSGSGNAPTGTAGVSAVGAVDPDLAEREWCAIAWPRMYGEHSKRMFLVTARGEVLSSSNDRRVTCSVALPQGPADVLPPGWKPGDPVPGEYTATTGEVWKRTN